MWTLFEVTEHGDFLVETIEKFEDSLEEVFCKALHQCVSSAQENVWFLRKSEKECVGGVRVSRFHERCFRLISA